MMMMLGHSERFSHPYLSLNACVRVCVSPRSNGLTEPVMCAKSHTCGNQLCLPAYPDVASLASGMTYTLMDGGFGMA